MKCGGHYENFKLQMWDYYLKTHMFVVDIGACDIVLGAEWLRTLSLVTMDSKELYMSFVKDSHTINLKGIQEEPLEVIILHYMEKLLKNGYFDIISQLNSIEALDTNPIELPPNL